MFCESDLANLEHGHRVWQTRESGNRTAIGRRVRKL